MELREEFLKAYIGALCRLRVLTQGLSKLASEEAARDVFGKTGLQASGSVGEALRKLLEAMGVPAEVTVGEETARIAVSHPCPLSWPGCEELCPLPHASSAFLSPLGRWYPRRFGHTFVEVLQGSCRFELARAPGARGAAAVNTPGGSGDR